MVLIDKQKLLREKQHQEHLKMQTEKLKGHWSWMKGADNCWKTNCAVNTSQENLTALSCPELDMFQTGGINIEKSMKDLRKQILYAVSTVHAQIKTGLEGKE